MSQLLVVLCASCSSLFMFGSATSGGDARYLAIGILWLIAAGVFKLVSLAEKLLTSKEKQ